MILTPKQMAELKEYKNKNHPHAGPDAWLFPGKRNRPLDMGWLMSHHVKPLAEELGMQRIHWHALRHLNNSLMMNGRYGRGDSDGPVGARHRSSQPHLLTLGGRGPAGGI